MTKTFAVDADIIAYRSASVTQDKDELIEILDNTLGNISSVTSVKHMRLYLSGENNFRHDAAKTKPYKGNRKQLLLRKAKQYLQLEYGAIVVDGYEADDAIASDMKQNGAIHCGIDKDILQVAGTHYNFVKEAYVEVSEEQAKYNLYHQLITGDSTDNIGGLPNYGEVKANEMLQGNPDPELACKMAYMEVIGDDWHDYYQEQYALVKLVDDLNMLDLITKEFKGRLF